jgi:hypothetical protein
MSAEIKPRLAARSDARSRSHRLALLAPRRLLRALLPSARSLRMSAYALVAFGAPAIAASRSVYADVREVGLGLGRQLARLEDLTGEPSRVRVNGAEVSRASAWTAQSTGEVLDRYEAYCRESPGALGRALADIPRAVSSPVERAPGGAPPAPLVRVREETRGPGARGMVACFVDPPGAAPLPLAARLRALVETGDLSRLGHFRYVFAEPSKGARGGTHVVTFWSDSELNLGAMFPATGDAPGTDSTLAPRPAGARRTLSASVDGYPAAVRIYETATARPSVEAALDEELRARGFARLAPPGGGGARYLRGDVAEVLVSFGERQGRTTVTLVEAGASRADGVRAEEAR